MNRIREAFDGKKAFIPFITAGDPSLEVTRQLLLERLWDSGGNFVDDHTLTVTMNRLRAKIEDENHAYIRTVRGMGYIWKGERP